MRHGTTLIQLIVMIAGVGLLAILLFPAVQSAQEEQNFLMCRKNLHEIGIGFHNYHDINGFLPSGRIGHNNGVFSQLLPYVEQQNLAAALSAEFDTWQDPDVNDKAAWFSTDTGWELCQTKISLFVCPSADAAGLGKAKRNVAGMKFSVEDKTAEMTLQYLDTSEADGIAGLSTYGPCAGAAGFHFVEDENAGAFTSAREGMFSSQRRKVITQILDGTSNTLGIGEYLGEYDEDKEAWTLSGSWAAATMMWTAKPLAESAQKATYAQFSSPHEGINNFVLGDASVFPLSTKVDLQVLRDIGGIRDGNIVDLGTVNR